jgi:hypothetical protein
MSSLFPRARWCVSAGEARAYLAAGAEEVLAHPNKLHGLAAKRQWILDRVPGPVFMVDDDVTGVWCNVGEQGHRIYGWQAIEEIIQNCAHAAASFGAPVFGFSQAWDVRKYDPCDPFSLAGWVGTAIGFLGREIKYDTSLTAQADIDFCLCCMLKKRIVFIDNRFAFICKRFLNAGGSAGIRTAAEYERQIERVTARWGSWISFKKAKGTYRLNTRVSRRQALTF